MVFYVSRGGYVVTAQEIFDALANGSGSALADLDMGGFSILNCGLLQGATATNQINDTGTGWVFGVATGNTLDFKVDTVIEFRMNSTEFNVGGNRIINCAELEGVTDTNEITDSAGGWLYDVATGADHRFQVNGITQLLITVDTIDISSNYMTLSERTDPATATANAVYLYAKDKAGISELYYINDNGDVRDLSATGGGSTNFSDAVFYLYDDAVTTKHLMFELTNLSGATTRTITMIDEDLVIVGLLNIQTIQNKTFIDTNNYFADGGDPSKLFGFDCSGISTLTTRTITVPNANFTMAGINIDNAFTGSQNTFAGSVFSVTSTVITLGDSSADTLDIYANTSVKNEFKIESTGTLVIENPGGTFSYTIVPSAIGANRNIVLPLTTALDTIAVLGLSQTFTGTETFTGTTLLYGTNTTVGNATSDSLTITARVSSDINPQSDINWLLGSEADTLAWLSVYASYYKFKGSGGTIGTSTATIYHDGTRMSFNVPTGDNFQWYVNGSSIWTMEEDGTLQCNISGKAHRIDVQTTSLQLLTESTSDQVELWTGTSRSNATFTVDDIGIEFLTTTSSTGTLTFDMIQNNDTPAIGRAISLIRGIAENSSSTNIAYANIEFGCDAAAGSITNATECGYMDFYLKSNGSDLTFLEFKGSTTGRKIGFFGATPVIRTTGWVVTNKTTDRTLDCNGALDQVADNLGTLIDDLIALGLLSA